MTYVLRKPVGPVERQLLERACEKLAEFPEQRHVRFLLPVPPQVTLMKNEVPTNAPLAIYTVDRSPVGEIGQKPVLVITVESKPYMLFSPYFRKIAEKTE